MRKATLLICLLLSTLSCAALAAPPIIPAPPELAAKSWILMDVNTGKIIVQHNADQRLPPASLTKIMTAYITATELKAGMVHLTDRVRVSVKAWRTGGSRMFIREGTYVSLKKLLEGMIVDSGNDATVAISQHVAGSEDAFVNMMNQEAARLGMKNTHYMNATGLPHENHYSTAHDLAKLTIALITRYPKFYKDFFSQKYLTYDHIKQANRNELLWRDPHVDGVKTGHTEEAGYCLIASAVEHGMRLVSVVMGTQTENARSAESQKLLTYGFRYYNTVHLYQAGDVLKKVRVWEGDQSEVGLGLARSAMLTLPRGGRQELKATMHVNGIVKAPVKQGQKLGELTVKMGGKDVFQGSLLAMNDVDEAGFFERAWDEIVLFFTQLFGGNMMSTS